MRDKIDFMRTVLGSLDTQECKGEGSVPGGRRPASETVEEESRRTTGKRKGDCGEYLWLAKLASAKKFLYQKGNVSHGE
jgi:hypothetical protein